MLRFVTLNLWRKCGNECVGEDGKRALTTEFYAFEIDGDGWQVWDWRCTAEDDQITDLLRRIDNLYLDVPHIQVQGIHFEKVRRTLLGVAGGCRMNSAYRGGCTTVTEAVLGLLY